MFVSTKHEDRRKDERWNDNDNDNDNIEEIRQHQHQTPRTTPTTEYLRSTHQIQMPHQIERHLNILHLLNHHLP